MLLELDNVTTFYGQMRILTGVAMSVDAGELVCLLGGNASGKSTTLKTILGIVRPRDGRVLLEGEDVSRWPVAQRIAGGLAIVPENRRLFGQMTVRENLELGAVLQDGSTFDADLERVHTLFPRLEERKNQLAGTLSGGERFRAVLAALLLADPPPQLLLLDEPTNSLDLASVRQLSQALACYQGALLIASHDAPFLASIGITRWLRLSRDARLTDIDPLT
jgi:branched-chain amino acid transport system ATP-binding protein